MPAAAVPADEMTRPPRRGGRSEAAQARRKAADAAARRALLRLISHELRTPLNAIIGFSEIISTELYGPINDPRYREHAELVRDAGFKMAGLVNDVIELARLDAGLADLDLSPEDPLALLEEVLSALVGQVRARSNRLLVSAAPSGLVMVDARLFKAALAEAISRALATAHAGDSVSIVLARSAHTLSFRIGHGSDVPYQDMAAPRLGSALIAEGFADNADGMGLPIAALRIKAMGGVLQIFTDAEGRFSATLQVRSAAAL